MVLRIEGQWKSKLLPLALSFVILLLLVVPAPLRAQQTSDLDNYKLRVDGDWWFSHPTGYFGLQGSDNYFNVNHDFGFGDYSTFTGRVDWHFKHKHHFLFTFAPVNNTKTATISRTIEFQGQTYDVGGQVTAKLRSYSFGPGYQYDIIRRNHGFLGIEVDVNLLDSKASLSGVGTVNGVTAQRSSSKTFFAPLPILGPVFRWYPLHDSNRFSVYGSFRGMSFFGYGNFLASSGGVNIGITQRLMFQAGYQLGSRLSIHGTSDEIAVQLAQKGPTAGLEYSWGDSPEGKPHQAKSTNAISEWHVDWIPFYMWFTGLQGNVGAQGYVVPVDVSFSQVFSQLNIGLMTDLDVRRKRIGLLTDLLFISVSSDQRSTPVQGGAYSGFRANAKTFMINPDLYYRVIEKQRFSADFLAGARFWRLDNSISLQPGTFAAASVGQTQSWVDPVLGARFRAGLGKGWTASLIGDAGGFGAGSQLTWQVYTGIGKEFKEKYSVLLGYRYLDVDYKNGGFLYDTHMSGLLAGFAIRLK